jgi:two-component system sensor histidine kinase KdpD
VLFRSRHGIKHHFGAQERILICITPRANVEEMLDTARLIADTFHAEIIVAYVRQAGLSASDEAALKSKLALAQDLGVRIEILDSEEPTEALFEFARSRDVTQIFIGHTQRSKSWLRSNPVEKLIRGAWGMDVRIFPH